MQAKVDHLDQQVKELKQLLEKASKTSSEENEKLHMRINEVEKHVHDIELEVKEVVLKIPSNMRDMEQRILSKMDSDQVDQLKTVLQSYRSIVAKLGWAIIGIISSVITALILSYLSLR
jgi:DNA repair exonuclease SbcCD ATPase subunit